MNAALRSTHVSVPAMHETRRVALHGMPATEITVVTAALRIQELANEHSQEIDSLVFFPCHVVFDENPAERRKP